jgi:hypothetical protein
LTTRPLDNQTSQMSENQVESEPETSTQNTASEFQEIILWDVDEPRSVVNLLPKKVRENILELFQKDPIVFGLSEHDLLIRMRKNSQKLAAADSRLRMKFWLEYDRAQVDQTPINISVVISGVCSRELFYGHYMKRPDRVAYMLLPPTDYMIKAKEALEFGLDQMRDILEVRHFKDGKVDTALARLKLSIVEMLEERINGARRNLTHPGHQNNSMSVNVNLTPQERSEVKAAGQLMSEAEMDERLKNLEQRERRALHLNEIAPSASSLIDIGGGSGGDV